MTFVTGILAPIIQLAFYVAMGGWILYIFYKIFKRAFPNFRWYWKYKIKEYPEKDVAWCMDALNKGMNEIAVRKHLLINCVNPKKVDEMIFIFRKVRKRTKGGDTNGRQYEQSDGKVGEEIPKI